MVCPIYFRVNLPAQSLVHEVPDETTLVCRIFANHVPIFLETTHGVTHCMSVFALNQRFLRIGVHVALAASISIVHRAYYV